MTEITTRTTDAELAAVGATIIPEEIGTGVLVVRGKNGLESTVLTYDQVECLKMVLANMARPVRQTTIEQLYKELGGK